MKSPNIHSRFQIIDNRLFMPHNISSNRQIAKNTLLLYLRMFVTMLIGLYTSRVVLRTLGVSDYGVYNVVGGIISMTTFLNSALTGSAQRFFSFEIGRNNLVQLRKLYSTTIIIYFALAILVVVLLESVGIWFLNNRLNIYAERIYAANWVFQCSLAVLVINMISAPYNAIIIAYEKMDAYAYLSIFESLLKLVVVFILVVAPLDRLIAYAILQFLVSIVVRLCYTIYCRIKFPDIKFELIFEKKIFKQLFSFSGWNLVGNLGFTLKDPLSNVIFNLFCGTVVNAARGVALQVNSLVCVFSTNLGMALNPPIIKQYAANNYDASRELVYAGARLAFFLVSIVAIPILLNIDFLLNLWLGADRVPDYTAQFLVVIVVLSLINALTATSSTAVQATGNIKLFSIGVCFIPLAELPLTYLLLSLDYEPYIALTPAIFTSFMTLLFRYYVLTRQVPIYRWRPYLVKVVLRSIALFVIAYTVSWISTLIPFKSETLRFFIVSIWSIGVAGVIFLSFGLEGKEKQVIKDKIHSIRKHE